MHLKCIKMKGFKSFADSIKIEFPRGITSIVGPNGSGKSNIADAVRWVLGEQNPRLMRGSNMMDVIFAGTEYRRSLGFAEVSLILDNQNHKLPIDYSEVTISRKLYRSGESEYLLNGTKCRLKDIHEVIVDTGLGKDGYCVIGQGKIDEILSSKPEDRRNIFEEASGIIKYKERKLEAKRKLERTDENVIRIDDILIQLELQIEPLREQSVVARSFLDFRESLKELEIAVYVDNIEGFNKKITKINSDIEIYDNNILEKRKEVENIIEENKVNLNESKEIEDEYNKLKDKYFLVDSEIEKINSELALNNEKARSNRENIIVTEKELEEYISEFNNSKELLTIGEEEYKEHLEIKNKYILELKEYEMKLDEINNILKKKEEQKNILNSNLIESINKLSEEKAIYSNLKYKKIEMSNQIENNKNSLSSFKSMLTEKEDVLKSNITQKESKENILEEAQKRITEFTEKRSTLVNEIENIEHELAKNKSELYENETKLSTLSALENNLEGYGHSVKDLIAACNKNKIFGIGVYGALAQLTDTEDEYVVAIEIALGRALQNVVVEDETCAKRLITHLKTNRLGRVTFLPINSITPRRMDDKIRRMTSGCKGFISIASDLVKCEDKYRGIVDWLLCRTLIATDIDSALEIAAACNREYKIVTLDGDIIHVGGSMTGGSISTRARGLLGRTKNIEKLKRNISNLEPKINISSEKLSSLQSESKEFELEVNNLYQNINNIKEELMHINNMINQGEIVLESYSTKESEINELINELSVKIEKNNKDTNEYESIIEKIEKKIELIKNEINQIQENQKIELDTKNSLMNSFNDIKVKYAALDENLINTKKDIDRFKENIEKFESVVQKKKEKNIEYTNQNIMLKESNNKHIIRIGEINKSKELIQKELKSIEKKKDHLNSMLSGYLEKNNEINEDLEALISKKGKIENNIVKIESDIEALQNRMWDEYEITINQANTSENKVTNISNALREIRQLKNSIKELGDVNVGAIEQYNDTKKRYTFMKEQREDLEGAKKQLNKIITQMNSIMEDQFADNFKIINKNFQEVFKELFGGGNARLELSDQDNILESGVEIIVQPPGKKLQNMTLLSGGEKAFTAIALLFAILKIKPSPFCVLDEIEAALDDVNVYRFCAYLKGYIDKTQFILVTHRKGTMENSDVLYGVTMQEHGVSNIVSLDIEDTRGIDESIQ